MATSDSSSSDDEVQRQRDVAIVQRMAKAAERVHPENLARVVFVMVREMQQAQLDQVIEDERRAFFDPPCGGTGQP